MNIKKASQLNALNVYNQASKKIVNHISDTNSSRLIGLGYKYMWPDLPKGTTSVKTSQKHEVVYLVIHFQLMFSTLYLSLKTINNLNEKFSKHLKNAYIHTSVLNGLIEVVTYCKPGYI